MKNITTSILIAISYLLGANAVNAGEIIARSYPDIIKMDFTPKNVQSECPGLFTDAGSWIGFTNPDLDEKMNGFCGPYAIGDQQWISKSLAEVGVEINGRTLKADKFMHDSTSYFPGFLYMKRKNEGISVVQKLYYVDKNHALLELSSEKVKWNISSSIWLSGAKIKQDKNSLIIKLTKGEVLVVSFPTDFTISIVNSSYNARSVKPSNKTCVLISFYNDEKLMRESASTSKLILKEPSIYIAQSKARWEGYLSKIIRSDMPQDYNRVAVKSVVTLISNWRSAKDGLLHDGIIPSHAFAPFLGFWAWDSWKHAAATAHFAPELAKNQVRAMFDYQTDAGMIPDCIYTNKQKNNVRDSKPPLAAWAVMEIYNQTKDIGFVKEMFYKLVKYNHWWFANRDHNKNGICEYGSADGTIEAAKWESGMDNAVRFDSVRMLRNSQNAWSFNQESVDLNAFLFLENRILKEMSLLINSSYLDAFDQNKIENYFFEPLKGYYYDRKLEGGFISIEGSESFIPLWTSMATKEHAAATLLMYEKPNKFSTYIPFPTLCADHPKFSTNSYWRGPIWLDQVYFGISGIRKYGFRKQADNYTNQVFYRLCGLTNEAPIYENYDTQTGKSLRAAHFSWSAAHLLMLYWEYGK